MFLLQFILAKPEKQINTIKAILPRVPISINLRGCGLDFHLREDAVLEELKKISRVVYPILPGRYKITNSGRTGLYPHPVALSIEDHAKFQVLDYKLRY